MCEAGMMECLLILTCSMKALSWPANTSILLSAPGVLQTTPPSRLSMLIMLFALVLLAGALRVEAGPSDQDERPSHLWETTLALFLWGTLRHLGRTMEWVARSLRRHLAPGMGRVLRLGLPRILPFFLVELVVHRLVCVDE